MSFGKKLLKYKEEIVNELREIVRIRSVKGEAKDGAPFGEGPANALNYALGLAKRLGFKAVNVDGYAGYAEYGEGEGYTAVITHLDVVPEGEGWKHAPYDAEIEDGKIYGRGVSDNKSGAVLALYALKILADEGIVPTPKIRVIFGCDEESGMEDIKYYFAKEGYPTCGFVPDSDYPIINAEKGILHLKLTAECTESEREIIKELSGGTVVNAVPASCILKLDSRKIDQNILNNVLTLCGGVLDTKNENGILTLQTSGVAAHGSHPEKGENAIIKMFNEVGCFKTGKITDMIKFVNDYIGNDIYGEKLGINHKEEYSGSLTLNLGVCKLSCNKIQCLLDIRYPIDTEGEKIYNKIKEKAAYYGIDVVIDELSEPLNVSGESRLVSLLKKAYTEVTGEIAQTSCIGGGTYARKTNNTCVGFGGVGDNYHTADEYVKIDELMRHGMIMTQALKELSAYNIK